MRAAAAVAALGVLLWVGLAHAFCREVTATPPADYDPVDAGCFAGANDAGNPPLPLFWRNQCVSYSVQQNASVHVALSDARRVARQAFDTWTQAPCSAEAGPSITEFEYGPPVACDQVPSNEHNNPIIFRDTSWPYDSANALGFTTLTVNLDTGEIYGATIEINSSRVGIVANVDGSIPSGDYDLASILTHEAGHFLGLAHSAESGAVMNAHYRAGQSTLTLDDVSGICSVYPADFTRSTGAGVTSSALCNATPPLGFSSTCGTLDASALFTGSGPLAPVDAGDPPCSGTNACAMSHGPSRGGPGLAIGAIVTLGVLTRRRSARRSRWPNPRCRGPSTSPCQGLRTGITPRRQKVPTQD
jgi:hypothetical protein